MLFQICRFERWNYPTWRYERFRNVQVQFKEIQVTRVLYASTYGANERVEEHLAGNKSAPMFPWRTTSATASANPISNQK